MIIKDRRAQIAGQVFIYMMAVIVIGGIALIGYKALSTISDKACQAEKATFKMDLEGLIEKYTSYGSVNKKTIKAPCDYDTICFVDFNAITDPAASFSCPENRLIYSSVDLDIKENVFVMSRDHTIPAGYSDLVTLADPTRCLCINQTNKNFYITFSGMGSSTQISRTG